MFEIHTTASFRKQFEKLPKPVQTKTSSLIDILALDYRDPRLHTKKLYGERIEYSFRVYRDYRCIFCFEAPNVILLIDIAHRKDIYR